MKLEISKTELDERISLNENRLLAPYYQFPDVFQPITAEWSGDKEGRALLAFMSHYKITGKKNPAIDAFIKNYKERTNGDLYFGKKFGAIINEQQLSGHSWLLRGLCEYAEQFSVGEDSLAESAVKSIFEHLYFPTAGKYSTYPTNRKHTGEGGVSGNVDKCVDGWNLSTDIGCAFMSIDGLSHAYQLTQDERIRALTDEMIVVFGKIDKKALNCQTHCSLTAARGMIRMFQITKDEWYLTQAKDVYNLYTAHGKTLTDQNYNWWGREDSWTEPCAIVDSLMVAHQLWQITGEAHYRTEAARIFHNGFASAQRENGGAGPDSCVYSQQPVLRILMYEAPFCCTMRFAEGLWYVNEHCADLWAETDCGVKKTENGVYTDGDIVYAELLGEEGKEYRDASRTVTVDGHTLSPLLKFYRIPKKEAVKIKQKVVFNDNAS